jgi:hypothetical protein
LRENTPRHSLTMGKLPINWKKSHEIASWQFLTISF